MSKTKGDQMDFSRQLFFDNHPDPMWVFELDTLQFLAVNNVAEQEFGFSKDEFLAQTIADLRPKEDIPRLFTALESIRDGFQVGGRWNLLRKNGTVMVADIRWHTLEYAGKKGRSCCHSRCHPPRTA